MCPRSEAASNPYDHSPTEPAEFSPEERRLLLNLAHESILAAVEGRSFTVEPPSAHLAEMRGAFTTVYHQGRLRGCVGYAIAVMPLYQTIIETARAAATEDSRFPAITREEAREIEVSLSVLSPLQPVRAEEVKVGRHGLVISVGNRRGLLLPQVAVEHGWDRETFLAQTCRKAGLPMDAWCKGAEIQAFTAECFGDDDIVLR